MPLCLAYFCFICNIILPGTGEIDDNQVNYEICEIS